MKWIYIILLMPILCSGCCRYNGIDTREVLVSQGSEQLSWDANDSAINMTDERATFVR
jgi:hypothetical protein